MDAVAPIFLLSREPLGIIRRVLSLKRFRKGLVVLGWALAIARFLLVCLSQQAPNLSIYFEVLEFPLDTATWILVIMCSLANIRLLSHILLSTTDVIKRATTLRSFIITCVLFLMGILSFLTFGRIVEEEITNINKLKMGPDFMLLFKATAFIRSVQCIFSGIFTSIIMPISCCWADQVKPKVKKEVTSVLTWRVILFLHWNTLLPTFFTFQNLLSLESLSHVASFSFRLASFGWLLLLIAYANRPVVQEEQSKPTSQNSELVACSCLWQRMPGFSELVIALTNAVKKDFWGDNELVLISPHRR